MWVGVACATIVTIGSLSKGDIASGRHESATVVVALAGNRWGNRICSVLRDVVG